MFQRLRHDVELKKQIVTVAIIATIVIALESIIFFAIVTPQVMDSLRDMLDLRLEQPALQSDPVAQAMVRCAVGIAHERETDLLNQNRKSAFVHAGLIGSLPLLLVLSLWAGSEPLRRARWWPIVVDVSVTAACIGLFQVIFYFLGKRWRYAGDAAMVDSIAKEYAEVSAQTNAATDCAPCMEKLQALMNKSPTIIRLRKEMDRPEELLRATVQQLMRMGREPTQTAAASLNAQASDAVDRIRVPRQ